jgi:hypothetical protein
MSREFYRLERAKPLVSSTCGSICLADHGLINESCSDVSILLECDHPEYPSETESPALEASVGTAPWQEERASAKET